MDVSGSKSMTGASGNEAETTNFENVKIEASVPNSSWSKELTAQYEKYMGYVNQGDWKKIPSYFDSTQTNRLFSRAHPPTGVGFEYALFMKNAEKILHAIIQFGPYLEGPKTYVHGGAICTALDETVRQHMHNMGYMVVTLNISVDFKKPLPIGTVAIIESKFERRDRKKVYTSGVLRSIDGSIIYDKCTGLWFDFAYKDEAEK